MSHILATHHLSKLPDLVLKDNLTHPSSTLNASNETCYFVGNIVLENPLSSSKTISAAGGGSIVWLANAVVFANGGSTFKVGIQDVSTASSPAQGDGTFDVEASFTGGGGGITGGGINTSVMTSGTKTIANGDLVAITFSMTGRAGSDSVNVAHHHEDLTLGLCRMPVVTNNTTGSVARVSNALPLCYILFDDGTIGWIFGSYFITSAIAAIAYNSGSATADEYGNLLYNPFTFYATAIAAFCTFASTSADAELLLYSTPLGTPVVERTVTIDATQLGGATGTAKTVYMLPTPFLLKANTEYGITLRPTTANNVTLYMVDSSSTGGKTGSPNSNCYAMRRLDNTGAFSDYNGGTAKTRQLSIYLIGIHAEQGVNMCSGQVGVF